MNRFLKLHIDNASKELHKRNMFNLIIEITFLCIFIITILYFLIIA